MDERLPPNSPHSRTNTHDGRSFRGRSRESRGPLKPHTFETAQVKKKSRLGEAVLKKHPRLHEHAGSTEKDAVALRRLLSTQDGQTVKYLCGFGGSRLRVNGTSDALRRPDGPRSAAPQRRHRADVSLFTAGGEASHRISLPFQGVRDWPFAEANGTRRSFRMFRLGPRTDRASRISGVSARLGRPRPFREITACPFQQEG